MLPQVSSSVASTPPYAMTVGSIRSMTPRCRNRSHSARQSPVMNAIAGFPAVRRPLVLRGRPGRQVEQQPRAVRFLRGDDRQPPRARPVHVVGLEREAELVCVEGLRAVLIVDEDGGQPDEHGG